MLHGKEMTHIAIAIIAPRGPITSQKSKQPIRICTRGYRCLDTNILSSRHSDRCTRLSGDGRTSCSTTRSQCCTIFVRVKWNWNDGGGRRRRRRWGVEGGNEIGDGGKDLAPRFSPHLPVTVKRSADLGTVGFRFQDDIVHSPASNHQPS